MLEHLNELIAAVYQTAPCPTFPEGVTWRAHADDDRYATQAAAWETVRDYCISQGMEYSAWGCGKEDVIDFIRAALSKAEVADKGRNSQAAAWVAVMEKCSSLGMYDIDLKYDGTGRGLALAFIQSLSDRLQAATETLDKPHPDTEDAKKWRALQECQARLGGEDVEMRVNVYGDGSTFVAGTREVDQSFAIQRDGRLS